MSGGEGKDPAQELVSVLELDFARGLSIEELEEDGEKLVFTIVWRGIGRARVMLRDNDQTPRLCGNSTLSFVFKGEEGSLPKAIEALLRRAALRLEGTTLKEVRARIGLSVR